MLFSKTILLGLAAASGAAGASIHQLEKRVNAPPYFVPVPESPVNSYNNTHPNLTYPIYPRAARGDAPYDVAESSLRGALYFPQGFNRNQSTVILFPGTGVPGGLTYNTTFGRLLQLAGYNHLWVNVPTASLQDAQTTAEYAAYSVNYVSAYTRRQVSIVGISQGSIDIQWALKYWPSARRNVKNLIVLSADFRGVSGGASYPELDNVTSFPPALLQQASTPSNFLKTLAANNGTDPLVPTTSLWSITDEVVQPAGPTNASARIGQANRGRPLGVNIPVQTVCPPGSPASLNYTHAGILVNPVAWAVTEQVLRTGRPGNITALNSTLSAICSTRYTANLTATEVGTVITGGDYSVPNIILYAQNAPPNSVEPPIKAYANQTR